MNQRTPFERFAVAVACIALSAGTVSARSTPDETPDADRPRLERRLGEEERIKKRTEWFFSTRTAGAANADERARLRREAVAQARAALARQRALRAEGLAETLNPWAPKGPSPSNFGGWAFGNVAGRATALAADWAAGILYFGTASGGLWKSTDDGSSWTQLFEDVGTMAIGAVAVDPNDPDVIWAGTGDNLVNCRSYFGLGLFRSSDGGNTWEERNGSGANTLENLASFADVIVDPRDSSHLVVGGRIRQCGDGSGLNGGIYTSTDAGLNWTVRLGSKQVYEIKQDPTVMDTFWAATDDGIYKSTDNAITWVQQTASGLPANDVGRCELAIAPSASSTVYVLFAFEFVGPPSLWRTTDGGQTWEQRVSGSAACDGQCSYNMVLRVKNNDPNTVYRGNISSFKSVDGGQTFTDLSGSFGPQQKVHSDTHVLLMHPTDPETYYIGTDGGLWKSVNGGASFTNLNGNLNTFQFYAIGVDAQNPERICGGSQDNSSVARTSNNVWSLQSVTGDGFTCHINPQDPQYSYISSYALGPYPAVLRSTTGLFGSYTEITDSGSGVIPNDRISWVTPYLLDPLNPNILYLGTHRIYRSDDHGSNWTQMGPDLTGGADSITNIGINRNFPDHLLTASGGGLVWRTTDGASNWTDISSGLVTGRTVNDVASDPLNPDRAFAVVGGFNTGHVWEWNDGAGWTDRSADLPNVPHNTVLMISSNEIIVGNDIGVYRSADGGVSWVPWMDGLPLGAVVTDLKYNVAQTIVTAGTYGNGAWQASLGAVSPILLFESASAPEEIDGNGDPNIDPGETWGLHITLRNGGAATALAPQGRLTTATPGVNVLNGGIVDFDDIFPGSVGTSPQVAEFIVEPDAVCGDPLDFDFVDMTATNAAGPFQDVTDAVSLTIGTYTFTIPTTLAEDSFDPLPGPQWSHEEINPGLSGCNGNPRYTDDWKVYEYHPSQGNTYHAGRGIGTNYSPKNHAWLYYAGKDSDGGAGITIPADAISATLTFDHWYETTSGQDGGLVALDSTQDGSDNYTVIEPVGGYPAGLLASGSCNGLEGMPAYQGASARWTTATFDLLPYKGSTVYLAFVFGSDENTDTGEGWYIDNVFVESRENGPLECMPMEWPGTVPDDALFGISSPGMIEASWGASCNAGNPPGQRYAIHTGDLELLRSSGTYNHGPVDGACDKTSPATFAFGPGSRYYLVLPNDGSREGSSGTDSQGNPRPAPFDVCGLQRIGTCD